MNQINKNLISVVLITLLVFASFGFETGSKTVVAADSAVSPSNTWKEIDRIFYDDFEDEILTERIISKTDNANYDVVEADGTMSFINSAGTPSGGAYSTVIDLKGADGIALKDGIYVISFKFFKTAGKRAMFNIPIEVGGNSLGMLYWLETSTAADSNCFRFPSNSHTLSYVSDEAGWHDFFFVYEHSSVSGTIPSWHVYFDDRLIYSGSTLSDRKGGLSVFEIIHDRGGTANTTYSIDDLLVYKAQLNERAVMADVLSIDDMLNEEKTQSGGSVIVGENMNLPLYVDDGSVVSWVSSDKNLIDNSGIVKRIKNGYPLSKEISLRAIFEYYDGKDLDETYEKEYYFRVKREEKTLPDNIDGDYIFYDDFSGGINSGTWRDIHYYDAASLGGKTVGSAIVKDGCLELTNTSVQTYGRNYQYSYFQQFSEDGSPLANGSGEYVFEYDIKKDNKSDVQSWLLSTYDRGDFSRIVFDTDRKTYNSTPIGNTPSETVTLDDGSQMAGVPFKTPALFDTVRSDWMHVKYHINMNNRTFSMWIDNAPILIDANSRLRYNGLHSFGFFVNTSGSSISIDNIKFYKLRSPQDVYSPYTMITISKDGKIKTAVDSNGDYRVNVTYAFPQDSFVAPTLVFALCDSQTGEIITSKDVFPHKLSSEKRWQKSASDATVLKSQEELYGYHYTDIVSVEDNYNNCEIKIFQKTEDGQLIEFE